LEVDGGVSVETIAQLREAGTTAFVAGTSVFKHPQGIDAGMRALRAYL
jgi:ribulose-phosphate 3-epimerase